MDIIVIVVSLCTNGNYSLYDHYNQQHLEWFSYDLISAMQIYANHVIHGLLKVKERQHTMLNFLAKNRIYVTEHFQPLLAEPTEFGDFTQLGQVESVMKVPMEPIQGFIFNFDNVHRTMLLSCFTLLLKSTFTASAGRLFHLDLRP